jgi:serine/threonine-protein kinase
VLVTSRPPDSPVHPGDILAGRYRVERVIGAGGMGVVVAARHLQLDDLVALKFLLPIALENDEAKKRFAREARAAVKIKSEHVARVSDVGTLENDSPYMVMEYLEGSDLAAVLRTRGALPVDEAVDFVLQACEAIAEAHSMGIIHRDLKPANLFVVRRPDGAASIKVLDFGISKMTNLLGTGSGPEASMTRTAATLGSPIYMSPEQLRSTRDVDARADIWSLGVILHELLTGSVPFQAETLPMLTLMIVHEPPASLRSVRPELPAELEAAVDRCLAKERDARYANVAELALALGPFAPARSRLSIERVVQVLRSAGIEAEPVPVGPAPAGPGTLASWGSTGGVRARGRIWIGMGVGAVVCAIAGGVIAVRLLRPQPTPPVGLAVSSTASVAPSATTAAPLPEPAPPAVSAVAAPRESPDAGAQVQAKGPPRKTPVKVVGAKSAAPQDMGWDDRRK